jgi:hypothetical protein
MSFGYMLDDLMVIQQNDYTQKGWSGLKDIFTKDSFMGYFKVERKLLEGGRYRPLSIATFAIENAIFGKEKPAISHFINILLYGLTGLLLYRIILGLFPLRTGQRWFFSVAFIAALFFLVHPLHTEAVANIKGRDEILALLLSLAALYAMLKYHDNRHWSWMATSLITYFLALLSKENAITFAFIIPLTIWFFSSKRLRLAHWLPLLMVSILFLIIRSNVLGYFLNPGVVITDIMNNPFAGMKISEKYATIMLTLGWYLKLLLAPFPLTHDYYPYHVPKVNWSDWRPLLSVVLYIGMAIAAIRLFQRKSIYAYCILFFLATLGIVSNLLFSVGTFMNERFLYMPSVAFCLFLAWLLVERLPALSPQILRNVSLGIVALLLGAFGFITLQRVPVWENTTTLNEAAIKVSYNSARANLFLVTAMYENQFKKETDATKKQEMLVTMKKYIDKSLEINPNYNSAMTMQAGIAGEQYVIDKQLEPLFAAFRNILTKRVYVKYIDDFMVYIQGRCDNAKFVSFCYEMGYTNFHKTHNDRANALKYVQYGLGVEPQNAQLLQAKSDIEQGR